MKMVAMILATVTVLTACGGKDGVTTDHNYWMGNWTAKDDDSKYCSQNGLTCGTGFKAGCTTADPAHDTTSGISLVGGMICLDSSGQVACLGHENTFTFDETHIVKDGTYVWDFMKMDYSTVLVRYNSTCAVKFTNNYFIDKGGTN